MKITEKKPFRSWATISQIEPNPGELLCVASANPGPAWRIQCGYMQRHRSGAFWKWLRQYFLWVTYKEDDEMEAGEFQCFTPSGKDITKLYQ